MMHLVHQHEPQHVHLTQVPHLLGCDEELYGLVELCIGRLLDPLHERVRRVLVRRDHLCQRFRSLWHLAELDAAVQGLLARFLLCDERPGELPGGLALAVWLQVPFAGGICLEHSHRGGDLPLQRSQELLLLRHRPPPVSGLYYASFTTCASFSKHLVQPISCRWRWSSVGKSSCVRTTSVALPRPRNSTVTSVSPASGSSSQRQVYTSFRGGSTRR